MFWQHGGVLLSLDKLHLTGPRSSGTSHWLHPQFQNCDAVHLAAALAKSQLRATKQNRRGCGRRNETAGRGVYRLLCTIPYMHTCHGRS